MKLLYPVQSSNLVITAYLSYKNISAVFKVLKKNQISEEVEAKDKASGARKS